MRHRTRTTIMVLFVLFIASSASSQWSDDISVNNVICAASERQEDPAICTDGDGGAIITWWDRRSDAGNIYAQRIDRQGIVRWQVNGAPICTTTQKQSYPKIVSDTRGGAIITWMDERTGAYSGNIYAQRIRGDGTMLWPVNGALVKSPAAYSPLLVSDGAAGAIIAWRDDRISVDAADVYAQHLDSTGAIQWTATGVAICTQSGQQMPAGMVSDDSGGAIIVWSHTRADGSPDIFARRVTVAGQTPWPAAGVTIAALPSWENYSRTISDGQGGIVVAWKDNRSNDGYDRIYAQRVSRSGTTQWTANGKLLTAPTQFIMGTLELASDGSDGAYLAYGSGAGYDSHLRLQRFDGTGTVLWDTSGVLFCGSTRDRHTQRITPDGAGGVIAVWTDGRRFDSATYTSQFNIYAQRLDNAGNILWAESGIPLSDAPKGQWAPVVVPASNQGAIAVWVDNRGTMSDIYSMHVNHDGSLTGIEDRGDIPQAFFLGQNFPNPFNPTTVIRFSLPLTSDVTLTVYDLLGREVAHLADGILAPGTHTVQWDAADLPGGVYFYRLRGGQINEVRKMLLIR